MELWIYVLLFSLPSLIEYARDPVSGPLDPGLIGAAEVLPEGAQIVSEPRPSPPMPMIGHVTSSYWSENLGHSIALALLRDGRARMGETVHLPLGRKVVRATVCAPGFYDVDGERMNG